MRPPGFAEVARVLRPGGRLVISMHRHVVGITPEQFRDEAQAAELPTCSCPCSHGDEAAQLSS